MMRRLFIIVSLLSLLMGIATIAIGPPSYRIFHSVYHHSIDEQKLRCTWIELAVYRGRLHLRYIKDVAMTRQKLLAEHGRFAVGWFHQTGTLAPQDPQFEGVLFDRFGFWLGHARRGEATESGAIKEDDFNVAIPLWFIASILILTGAIPFAIQLRRRLIRLGVGFCQKCGYDLSGNMSGVCPECGTAIPGKAENATT